jgi:uncharacterized hydrophobic protein (TIGR00341 family)
MALRFIEMIIPENRGEEARELLEGEMHLGYWQQKASDNQLDVKVLLPAGRTEAIMDVLEKKFSYESPFRLVLFPVEACIPRLSDEEERPEEPIEPATEKESGKDAARISREELYSDVVDSARVSRVYIAMVVLSSIVAAVGLLRDNVAVLIGAMVIAPMLGPQVALSLATTLGDFSLGRSALKATLLGLAIALVLSIGLGLVLEVNPQIPQIFSRTEVGLSDIALALASGAAGALAFTSGLSAALIGVMVAVALLPPLVTLGLLVGAGEFGMALGAMLLFLTNIICVNLAGVATFIFQGIRPLSWWEAAKAKKATHYAIVLWILLLAALTAVILFAKK